MCCLNWSLGSWILTVLELTPRTNQGAAYLVPYRKCARNFALGQVKADPVKRSQVKIPCSRETSANPRRG